MNCERFDRDLALLAGGELSEGCADEVRRHVAGCERCREELERYRADRRILGAVGRDTGRASNLSDEAFAREVASRFETPRHAWREVRWGSVAVKAAAVVLAAGALMAMAHLWTGKPTQEGNGLASNAGDVTAGNATPMTNEGETQYEVRRVGGPYVYSVSFPVTEAGAEYTDTARVIQSGSKWHVERVIYADDYADSY